MRAMVDTERLVRRRRALTETRAILAKSSGAWSAWSCPSTAECCQLAITQRPPWLWLSEWLVILEGLTRRKRPLPPPRADGACPFLDGTGKRCSIYEERPLGCRTFFCHRIEGPSKLPTEATHRLMDRLAAVNLATDATLSPQSILLWHAQQLKRSVSHSV
jgi:hypothetical protein